MKASYSGCSGGGGGVFGRLFRFTGANFTFLVGLGTRSREAFGWARWMVAMLFEGDEVFLETFLPLDLRDAIFDEEHENTS